MSECSMLTRSSTSIHTRPYRLQHSSETQPGEREQTWFSQWSGESFTPMRDSVRIERSSGRTMLSPPDQHELVSASTPLAATFSFLAKTLAAAPPSICDDDCNYLYR